MKPRILMVNECSRLHTGYSTYGNAILSRLHASKKYDVAELATYINPDKQEHLAKIQGVPWTLYLNESNKDSNFDSNPSNQFGLYSLEKVLLQFRPHIVFDIRDFWMTSFINNSPFRDKFHFVWMPTVDAAPQNPEWLDSFSQCDGLMTYSHWAKKQLEEQSGGKLNVFGVASPIADNIFRPLGATDQIKEKFGFKCDIIGTVMRNQRRKLFPELFEAFRLYLDRTDRPTMLYCHTSYPDLTGWDIPQLLMDYGIGSKVLFTYICRNCGAIYPATFQDTITNCKVCSLKSAHLANVHRGATNEQLNLIYNMFDVYVQPANSEGFGMPIVEAAACGVPLVVTNYSAMCDFVERLNASGLTPIAKPVEIETGCRRAIPSSRSIANAIEEALLVKQRDELKIATYEKFQENYGNWNRTADVWMQYFDNCVNIQEYENRWGSPQQLRRPAKLSEEIMSLDTVNYAKWLIKDVLCEPKRVGSYMMSRLIRDLSIGATLGGMSGMYYNENSCKFSNQDFKEFNKEIAYEHCLSLVNRFNEWEQLRG